MTVTVTSKSVLKTVAEVKANDTACTAGGDGTYTFTMPAENVTITVTMQSVQTEIPSDDVLSWRANAPDRIAKAPGKRHLGRAVLLLRLFPTDPRRRSDRHVAQ